MVDMGIKQGAVLVGNHRIISRSALKLGSEAVLGFADDSDHVIGYLGAIRPGESHGLEGKVAVDGIRIAGQT